MNVSGSQGEISIRVVCFEGCLLVIQSPRGVGDLEIEYQPVRKDRRYLHACRKMRTRTWRQIIGVEVLLE
jgi:hypothetical protein